MSKYKYLYCNIYYTYICIFVIGIQIFEMLPYRIDDRLRGQFIAKTFLITASKCELMPSYVPSMAMPKPGTR